MNRSRLLAMGEWILVGLVTGYLLYLYPWQDLLSATVTAGGDMASHFYPAKFMHDELLPRGQITGWTMGNYCGFPIFHFYSTLPFFLIAALGYIFPLEQTFKLITLLGPTMMPLCAAYMFRCLGYGRAASVIGAASVIPFLFQQGNSMWGGNLASVLAGEFCHSIGLSLSLLYLGLLHRTANGRGSIAGCALLLAATGLSHSFAFLGAVWFTLWYLWPRRGVIERGPIVVVIGAVAFLLLCFWGLPLVPRVKFTTEWSVIWHISDWTQIVPEPLWPAGILALINVALMMVRVKRFDLETHGLFIFSFFGAVVLYFIAPAVGFPDIRFVPQGQMFAGFLAVDLLVWAGSRIHYQLVYAAFVSAAILAWGQHHIGYLESWLTWNYSGYEGKVTWSLFDAINKHVAGDVNSPRMVFEHSQMHNRFGSSRAFENLPLFAGRSTLEGVFHQVSPKSPFAFYIQSEVSERTSGPFPQYTYMRLNPEAALPHLRHYNVSTIVAATKAAKDAYDAHPAFTRTFQQGGYAIYEIEGGDTGYVVAASNQPVLFTGDDYKLSFYRWFKHPELLDIPLVAELSVDAEAVEGFELRADQIADLPRRPYDGHCEVRSHLEAEKVSFDTTCPGRPHIVKVSYFPRWKAADGSPVHLVSPGFMMVYPSTNHFELYYGRTALDKIAWALTWIGLLWVAAAVLRPGLATSSVAAAATATGAILRQFEKHRLLLSVLLLAVFAATGAASRFSLRKPDQDYKLGQEAYKQRDFARAVELLRHWTNEDRETFKQATALYQLGVAYSELGDHAASVEVHERLRFEFPNINYGAGTLFHLAQNYLALGSRDEARQAARDLTAEFDDSSWAKRLRREAPELFVESD